jgi:hypothetical protein
MSRVTRISGSLAVVLIAYWAYALVAVPWIEPVADLKSAGTSSNGLAQGDGAELANRELELVKDLFNPGDWETDRSKTKVLRSDRAKLLLQEYRNLGSGKVKIEPCTIVFEHDGPAENEAQRHRQSIILQAEGAILQFDRPIDLRQPRESNLIGGQLDGPIRIRSDWKQPGPADDLLIVTSNVRLDKQTICTSEPVEFRWGPHFGSGQDMEIKLLSERPKPGRAASGLNVAGIESFELRHVERLHLDLGQVDEKGTTPITARGTAEKGSGPICRDGSEVASHKLDLSPFSETPSASTPVEITCRGLFRFDVVGRVATFNDSVHVVKLNPVGAADQMDCDALSIRFIERLVEKGSGPICRDDSAGASRKSAPSPLPRKPVAKKPGSMDLVPELLEARGNPVVVTAPSENVTARAQRVEYNLPAKSLKLDAGAEKGSGPIRRDGPEAASHELDATSFPQNGDQQVFLQQGFNEIHARSAFYQQAAEKDRLGRVVAEGPGWLRGQSPERPDQKIEAVWQERLEIQPHDQYQEVALTGGAELKSPGFGQLQARRISLWLLENPSAPKSERLKPHSLTASEDVHIGSAELSSKRIEQLEVLFEEVNAGQGAEVKGMGGSPPVGSLGGTGAGSPAQQSSPPITLLPPTSAESTAQRQRFEVSGRLLRAWVLRAGKETTLSRLTIEDGVELIETQTEHPGERPIAIRGDWLELNDASGPNAHATVIGKPASFEGRGLAIAGPNININRGTNCLWIEGPGQMNVLIEKDLEGRPLPTPGTLTIEWPEGMKFDGQTAQFRADSDGQTAQPRRAVVASTPGVPSKNGTTAFRLETAEMDVRLLQPVSFSQQKPAPRQDQQQIEEIQCRGSVKMDSRTFDARQQLASHDQMQLTYLTVNQINGRLEGGPGWINTISYGSGGALALQPPAAPRNAPATPDRLMGLYVTYRGSLVGNVLQRQATFRDQVNAAYGPVDNWDTVLATNDPNRLGPNGAVASCDELTVVQMPLPTGDGRSVELYALGNAVVEGTTFRAVGRRITYTQAKDLFTLEGDGRTPATLYRQLQVGAQASVLPAQKILYWRKTNDVKIVDAQTLEVQLPDGTKR